MTAPLASLALLLQATGGNPLYSFLFQFAGIMAIVYFLFIRPQQKQKQQHEASLRSLKKGDEIVTDGGIVAEVVHIKETVKDGAPAPAMDDRVTIRSGDTRLVVVRGKIARVAKKTAEKTAESGAAT